MRWVQRRLDLAGVHDVLPAEILDSLNDSEDEICKDYRVQKGSVDIQFNGSSESFSISATLFSVSCVRTPTGWQPIELTSSLQKYERAREDLAAGTNPRICLIRDGSAYFWPIGPSGETVTLVGDAGRAAVQVEGTGDPVVSADWDTALRYGALYRLTDNEEWKTKYDAECQTTGHRMMVASGIITKGRESQERLGF